MMATLRRSGFATSALLDCDDGFSTDADILPVYRRQGSVGLRAEGLGLRAFRQAGDDLFRALAELLVVDNLFGELPRFGRLREVVVSHRDVEPRRRQVAPRLGDVLLAPGDLLRL